MSTRSRSVGSPDATRAVDWEQRIDFPRLRQDRLDRAKAALEEEVVVTATGCNVITRFPADELLVAGRTYMRGADLIAGGDDGQHDNTLGLAAAVASSAVVGPVTLPR